MKHMPVLVALVSGWLIIELIIWLPRSSSPTVAHPRWMGTALDALRAKATSAAVSYIDPDDCWASLYFEQRSDPLMITLPTQFCADLGLVKKGKQ